MRMRVCIVALLTSLLVAAETSIDELHARFRPDAPPVQTRSLHATLRALDGLTSMQILPHPKAPDVLIDIDFIPVAGKKLGAVLGLLAQITGMEIDLRGNTAFFVPTGWRLPHTVKAGETLSGIATAYASHPLLIWLENPAVREPLVVGQELQIPVRSIWEAGPPLRAAKEHLEFFLNPPPFVEPFSVLQRPVPARELAGIDIYSMDPVGVGAVTSRGEELWQQILLTSPSAEADFIRVFETGTTEAKLYALQALQILAPEAYRKRRLQLDREAKVRCLSACIPYSRRAGDILDGFHSFWQHSKPFDELSFVEQRMVPPPCTLRGPQMSPAFWSMRA
jgi:LysM repeat protein